MTPLTGTAPQPPADDQATRLRRLIDTPLARTRPTAAHELADPPAHCPTLHAPPIITVASGKGGVGKSIAALSIALELARERRVTIIDADFGAANTDVLLGIAPLRRLDESFHTRFAPGRRPADIAIDVAPNLRLVPGIVGGRLLPDARSRRALLERLVDFHTSADVLVIDAAAGVHPAVIDMLAAADCPLLVVTPEPTAVADSYALLKSLARTTSTDAQAQSAAARAFIAVNQALDRRDTERIHRRLAAVADRFLGIRPPLAGAIPRDDRIARAVRAQQLEAIRRRPKLRRAIRAIATGALAAATEAHTLRTARREGHARARHAD
ncbi:MAG: P-loop NTPase [Planctomycetota bacterium]